MKNIIIGEYESQDIQGQVDKIIRGLGNPDPPLILDDARELLLLDRKFYSSADTSAVSEVVSRLTVAGKQIIKRPMILFDAIRKAKLSALWLPDKKRILLDESQPKLKHRWNEAHEIGHSIIPWHDALHLGDNEYSLNPACHARMEAEANYAAGQLLFLQDRFRTEALDSTVGLNTVKELKVRYGNTLSSTLWRYIEEVGGDTPMVGVISAHPHRPNNDFDPDRPCRHVIQSRGFKRAFSKVSEKILFREIRSYCGMQSGGPLGESDVILKDDNGDKHAYHFESFFNRYDVLTLGRYLHPLSRAVSA
ncbi:MAG: ImmA/IrrE family metallo-endopeptidase [Pirellulales bacterium]|nr:ImmA/IrrE family metallo-endopeptidase [Pirellulales bacterium]